MRNCADCKYSIHEDHGYSNYTVEGTNVSCLLNLNPDMPVDRGWRAIPITFAETCPRFADGGIQVDVDREDGDLENYTDDPELKILCKKFQQEGR